MKTLIFTIMTISLLSVSAFARTGDVSYEYEGDHQLSWWSGESQERVPSSDQSEMWNQDSHQAFWDNYHSINEEE